ncbi:MAG: TlpA family protein disulfide reductase [Deltaproteobacteria bacterium]|nr:TlpA family protein disulfide reductase [Deltaproteobacteria bacterium]
MRHLAAVVALALAVIPSGRAGAEETKARGTLYAFFATWCVPCRAELPEIDRVHREFGPRGLKVRLVSIDSPSSAAELPGFLEQFGIAAPWIMDSETELLVRYNPAGGVPFTVLLDDKGRKIYARTGYEPGDEADLTAAIEKLLHASPGGVPADADGAPASDELIANLTIRGLGVWRRSNFDVTGDGDLGGVVTRVEPQVRYGRYAVSARMDGGLLGDDRTGAAGDLRLERFQVDLDFDWVRIRAGDHYVQFGQGMSLSLRRLDSLGTDTSLRGGRLDFESGMFRAKVVGGVINPQNFDPIEMRVVGDLEDWLTGLEMKVVPNRNLEFGAYAVAAGLPDASLDGRDVLWAVGGGSTAMSFGKVRVSAEGAAGLRQGIASDDETPWGVTGSLSSDLGPVTWLVEGKCYRHWNLGRPDRVLAYHEPATLERPDQQIPGNEDSHGWRTRLDWQVIPELTVYANGLLYWYSLDGSSPLFPGQAWGEGRTWHAFGGLDLKVGTNATIQLAGGYRDENNTDGSDSVNLWHLDFDASFPLAEKLSMTLTLNHVSETKIAFSEHDFVRGLATVGLAWPGVASIAFLYGYSTEVPVRPTHYPGGEVKVVLPLGSELRLFGGRLAGGRVCVSGTCRDLPPFEGLRLDLVMNL